jgi:hypothetical protein
MMNSSQLKRDRRGRRPRDQRGRHHRRGDVEEHARLGGPEVAGGALGRADARAERGVNDREGERQVDDDMADPDRQQRATGMPSALKLDEQAEADRSR